jgi:peptidoglycan-N-acetylmuramic acid deacetylase
MALELKGVDDVLRTKFGYSSPFFRFPEGSYSECALDLVQSLGYKSVFWSSAYADWDTSNQKGRAYAFNTVTSRLHPGCVLLLHSVSKDNAEAMGDIIDWARAQGYEFKAL